MQFGLPRRILCVSNLKALPLDCRPRLEMEFNLFYAVKAAEGYALARRQQFNLFLFSDRLLTGSGIELYKKVRAFDARTPAILLLCDARKCQEMKARDAKARLVLSIPFNPDFLFEAICKLIAGMQEGEGSP
jgi:DNA-binding NarL/FixJ family response regulator